MALTFNFDKEERFDYHWAVVIQRGLSKLGCFREQDWSPEIPGNRVPSQGQPGSKLCRLVLPDVQYRAPG